MKKLKYKIIVLLIGIVFSSCEEEVKDIQIYNLPVYKNLYLVGDAVPAGWDINNPTPMTINPENEFEFTWEGELKPGEFKIPVSKGNWSTDFFMPIENGEIDLSKTTCKLVKGGNPDQKWKITDNTKGNYKLTVNVENLDSPTIKFLKL
jgi:hypothetical protein